MIHTTLTYIKDYLSEKLKASEWKVELGALSKEGPAGECDILITLLQIEEEREAKSLEYYSYQRDQEGKVIKITPQSPEIKLNLYILISSQKDPYETALRQISRIIGIFQEKSAFYKKDIEKEGVESLILDLYPLSFEQNNSLWQTLGATVMPSVMYKVRTIVVQESKDESEGPLIEKVKIRFKKRHHSHPHGHDEEDSHGEHHHHIREKNKRKDKKDSDTEDEN
jgi:hypothetical protein